jgi:hypothetical protein
MLLKSEDPAARMRSLHQRILAGDNEAVRELERVTHLAALESHVADAKRNGELREYRFSSSFPILGWIIRALRTAVNNLATKWVVRALMAQQNKFNAATSGALEDSLELNRWLLTRIEVLEARVAELEGEQHTRQ